MDVEDEGIVEAVRNVVIGKVLTVHGDLDLEDIGLRVLGDVYLELSWAEHLAGHEGAEVCLAEPNDSLAAVALGALEVAACDDRHLVVGALDWTILGSNSLYNGCIVVEITVSFLCWDD